MKFLIFLSILLVLFATKLVHSQNISTISIGICEIIKKFYTKYSRNLDIIDFGGTQSELVGQIMKNVNDSMTLAVQSRVNWDKWNRHIENQSILLFENFQNLSHFTNKDLLLMRYLYPIRLIVYYPNIEIRELWKLRTDTFTAHYYYFIVFNA